MSRADAPPRLRGLVDFTPAASAAPLLNARGALIALMAALVLCWPMLATGSYLVFSDTASYIRGGQIIWGMAIDMLGFGDGQSPAGTGGNSGSVEADAGGGNGNGRGYVVRSFIYSIYTLVTGATLWPAGFAVLQAAMTLWMLFALIGREAASRPSVLLSGFIYLAAVSTLPWFTAYLMPDILAAAVLIYAAILVRRFDDLERWQQFAIGAIAAFAVAAHYGHGPLAAGLFGAVLLWRLICRRLTLSVTVAAILPVLFSPLANLGASSVALDAPSVTPLRLPILLARSIEDGPARWYLEDVCPEAPLAFCEAFGDEVPSNIAAFLWAENGIESVSPEVMSRIREEEFRVLAAASLAYPLSQTASLFGNAALQTVKVGTGEIFLGANNEEFHLPEPLPRGQAVLRTFDTVTPLGTAVGALLLLGLLVSGRLTRSELEIVGVVVLGLLLNALIFGGLSAPVDRYQSRVAWLVPALAAIFMARRAGSVAPTSAPR